MNASTASILSLGSQRHGPVAAATGGRAKEATTSAVSKDCQATCSPGTSPTGRHQLPMPTVEPFYPITFEPRHCAGTGCTHNHAAASVPLRRLGVLQFLGRRIAGAA